MLNSKMDTFEKLLALFFIAALAFNIYVFIEHPEVHISLGEQVTNIIHGE